MSAESKMFAKLYAIGEDVNKQLLYTKEFDDDSYSVKIRLDATRIGADLAMTLGFNTEEERDRVFDGLTYDDAVKHYNALNAQIDSLTSGDNAEADEEEPE